MLFLSGKQLIHLVNSKLHTMQCKKILICKSKVRSNIDIKFFNLSIVEFLLCVKKLVQSFDKTKQNYQ